MASAHVIHGSLSVRRPRRLRLRLLAAALLGALVGVLGLRVAEAPPELFRTAATSPERPVPELPAEWRWQRQAVSFDHMYRKDPSPRMDWIRESR